MVQPYPNITAQLAVVPSSKWKLAINNPISYNDFTPSYVVSGMPIIFDSKYEMEIQFEHYDANGQLICWRETMVIYNQSSMTMMVVVLLRR